MGNQSELKIIDGPTGKELIKRIEETPQLTKIVFCGRVKNTNIPSINASGRVEVAMNISSAANNNDESWEFSGYGRIEGEFKTLKIKGRYIPSERSGFLLATF